ncbi:hypothetical protein TNCV_197011, partial [Trichonephila clavipes]
ASSLISLFQSQCSLSAIPGWTFHHFDFVSKCPIATPFLHVPTNNQVVPSPPRAATPSDTLAAVAEFYRYRILACLIPSSNPVPLKTRRLGQRCMLNLSRAETSSRWLVW